MWLLSCRTGLSQAHFLLSFLVHQYIRFLCGSYCTWIYSLDLGGAGVIDQIDESMIAKRKCHRGCLVKEQLVFGVIDTNSRKGSLTLVDDRKVTTLIPVIQRIVLPGLHIYSDCCMGCLSYFEPIRLPAFYSESLTKLYRSSCRSQY